MATANTTRRRTAAPSKTSGGAATVAKAEGSNLAKATETAASGALIEPDLAKASVIDHPAVDSNPRAGLPAESNQIDFNDPTKDQAEAVADNLAAQQKR